MKEIETMEKSVGLATKYGTQMMNECENSKEAIVASAIMLSTFCCSAGATDEQMMEVLSAVHQITKRFDRQSAHETH